jgi:hypothetical protein
MPSTVGDCIADRGPLLGIGAGWWRSVPLGRDRITVLSTAHLPDCLRRVASW